MKTAMTLTLDGLVRALRMRMHRMAEEIETGYVRDPGRRGTEAESRQGNRAGEDDVSGD